MPWEAIGSAIESGVTDTFNIASDVYKMWYTQDQQKLTQSREDNAVQRRVADLKAAGLSPVLAAGSAASSSSPVALNTPNAEANVVPSMLAAMTQKQQISQSAAQQALTEQNARALKRDNDINALMDSMKSDTGPEGLTWQAVNRRQVQQAMADKASADSASSSFNVDKMKEWNLPPWASQSAIDAASLKSYFLDQSKSSSAWVSGAFQLLYNILQGGGKALPGLVGGK